MIDLNTFNTNLRLKPDLSPTYYSLNPISSDQSQYEVLNSNPDHGKLIQAFISARIIDEKLQLITTDLNEDPLLTNDQLQEVDELLDKERTKYVCLQNDGKHQGGIYVTYTLRDLMCFLKSRFPTLQIFLFGSMVNTIQHDKDFIVGALTDLGIDPSFANSLELDAHHTPNDLDIRLQINGYALSEEDEIHAVAGCISEFLCNRAPGLLGSLSTSVQSFDKFIPPRHNQSSALVKLYTDKTEEPDFADNQDFYIVSNDSSRYSSEELALEINPFEYFSAQIISLGNQQNPWTPLIHSILRIIQLEEGIPSFYDRKNLNLQTYVSLLLKGFVCPSSEIEQAAVKNRWRNGYTVFSKFPDQYTSLYTNSVEANQILSLYLNKVEASPDKGILFFLQCSILISANKEESEALGELWKCVSMLQMSDTTFLQQITEFLVKNPRSLTELLYFVQCFALLNSKKNKNSSDDLHGRWKFHLQKPYVQCCFKENRFLIPFDFTSIDFKSFQSKYRTLSSDIQQQIHALASTVLGKEFNVDAHDLSEAFEKISSDAAVFFEPFVKQTAAKYFDTGDIETLDTDLEMLYSFLKDQNQHCCIAKYREIKTNSMPRPLQWARALAESSNPEYLRKSFQLWTENESLVGESAEFNKFKFEYLKILASKQPEFAKTLIQSSSNPISIPPQESAVVFYSSSIAKVLLESQPDLLQAYLKGTIDVKNSKARAKFFETFNKLLKNSNTEVFALMFLIAGLNAGLDNSDTLSKLILEHWVQLQSKFNKEPSSNELDVLLKFIVKHKIKVPFDQLPSDEQLKVHEILLNILNEASLEQALGALEIFIPKSEVLNRYLHLFVKKCASEDSSKKSRLKNWVIKNAQNFPKNEEFHGDFKILLSFLTEQEGAILKRFFGPVQPKLEISMEQQEREAVNRLLKELKSKIPQQIIAYLLTTDLRFADPQILEEVVHLALEIKLSANEHIGLFNKIKLNPNATLKTIHAVYKAIDFFRPEESDLDNFKARFKLERLALDQWDFFWNDVLFRYLKNEQLIDPTNFIELCKFATRTFESYTLVLCKEELLNKMRVLLTKDSILYQLISHQKIGDQSKFKLLTTFLLKSLSLFSIPIENQQNDYYKLWLDLFAHAEKFKVKAVNSDDLDGQVFEFTRRLVDLKTDKPGLISNIQKVADEITSLTLDEDVSSQPIFRFTFSIGLLNIIKENADLEIYNLIFTQYSKNLTRKYVFRSIDPNIYFNMVYEMNDIEHPSLDFIKALGCFINFPWLTDKNKERFQNFYIENLKKLINNDNKSVTENELITSIIGSLARFTIAYPSDCHLIVSIFIRLSEDMDVDKVKVHPLSIIYSFLITFGNAELEHRFLKWDPRVGVLDAYSKLLSYIDNFTKNELAHILKCAYDNSIGIQWFKKFDKEALGFKEYNHCIDAVIKQSNKFNLEKCNPDIIPYKIWHAFLLGNKDCLPENVTQEQMTQWISLSFEKMVEGGVKDEMLPHVFSLICPMHKKEPFLQKLEQPHIEALNANKVVFIGYIKQTLSSLKEKQINYENLMILFKQWIDLISAEESQEFTTALTDIQPRLNRGVFNKLKGDLQSYITQTKLSRGMK